MNLITITGFLILLLVTFKLILTNRKLHRELESYPARSEDMIPPLRETFVDNQAQRLVKDVLKFVQEDPKSWIVWGHYSKEGFGGNVTELEYRFKDHSVAIDARGALFYRRTSKEKKAVFHTIPLGKYDCQKIKEAYTWLVAEKARLVFEDKQKDKQKA